MVKCIVIDDQKYAIDAITDHIQKIPELSLVSAFINPLEAIVFLEEHAIDLVFIDVEMPHLNGIEFIEAMMVKKGNDIPYFILTTGHHKYALISYDYGVADYLMKPIAFKRLRIAVDKFLNQINKSLLIPS